MKLLDLKIHNFGKFHNRDISFQDGLNVIYGKNEAGKSTLHTFIRGMIYGIDRARGRASRNDTYTKYQPWNEKSSYEGRLRVEQNGTVYRIERNFHSSSKSFTIVNETLGQEVEPTKGFLDQLLHGLSETAYINTISIGQLKSATDSGMVTELKNYIANMNNSGNMALNITKASAFLSRRKREMEAQIVPEAALSYTTLLSEIRNLEKDISQPRYENQLLQYHKVQDMVKSDIGMKQEQKEKLLQKVASGKQVLENSQFTDQNSVNTYLSDTKSVYEDYQAAKKRTEQKAVWLLIVLLTAFGTAFWGLAGYLYFNQLPLLTVFLVPESSFQLTLLPPWLIAGGTAAYIGAFALWLRIKRHKRDVHITSKLLQEVFVRHLGDSSISDEAMEAFLARMADFGRLQIAIFQSEIETDQLTKEISSLQQEQSNCGQEIELQQRNQWDLERKLEKLAALKDQSIPLKHTIAENERLQEEIDAIGLAQETMEELSLSIRNSIGLYLNKTASEMMTGITGGIYTSMSVDEHMNIFLNTAEKLVPLEHVSSGTMDQVYLALRLAAARLIQGGESHMPLIFDDCFVLYDDDRLRTALKWLAASSHSQTILFTCHKREAQMLEAEGIAHNLITI